jgi:hypothetical protein
MSLLRDLVATLGDAMRLSSDLMRYKLEAQAQAVKRKAGRLGLCLSLYLAAALVIGTGLGFVLYGVFVLLSREVGAGVAGLIVGGSLGLIAVVLLLAARNAARRL